MGVTHRLLLLIDLALSVSVFSWYNATGTDQERARHQDQNTTVVAGWLRVQSRDLMSDFCERQALGYGQLALPCYASPNEVVIRTPSFSTIPCVPLCCDCSKVSIEWSRCAVGRQFSLLLESHFAVKKAYV